MTTHDHTNSVEDQHRTCTIIYLPEVAENYVRIALMGGNVKLKEGVVPHIFNCHKFKARTHRRKSLAAHHIRMRIDAVNEAVNNSKMDDDSNELFTYEISDENSDRPISTSDSEIDDTDWRYKTVRQIAQNENKNMWDSQRSQHSHHTDTHCEYNLPCQVIINEENEEISANGVLLEKFNHRTNNMKSEEEVADLKGQLVFQESMEDTGNPINSYEEYITEICDTVLLEKHEYSQTAEKPCSSGSSAQMEELDLTARNQTQNKIFDCESCGEYFFVKSAWMKHIRIHTKENLFECEVCYKSFDDNRKLNRHKFSHSDVYPHTCPLCDKKFKEKSTLKGHMMTHTAERPYICDVCKKTFTKRSNLQAHVRIHTNEKPFQCKVCEKCFSQSSSRNVHESIHTGEKPYHCTHCDKRFRTRGDFRRHLMTHKTVKRKLS